MHRARYGGKECSASMPSLGEPPPTTTTTPSILMCSATWKLALWTCTLGIFIEASSCRNNWLLTHSLALLSSLEYRWWGWKFQASNHVWPFWWPASIQEPIKSFFSRTKDISFTQEIPRGLGALCQKQCQWPNIRTKAAPSTFIIRKLQRF